MSDVPGWLGAIGSDRHLSIDEVPALHGDDEGREAWSLYQEAFGGYCESRLDPLFHRLDHPAPRVGALARHPAPVIVVGTGPSLAAGADALRRVRRRVRVATSPRGAEALGRYGIVPDLVLVEHRTALDAHHSARFGRDGLANPLRGVPLVAAEWRTPAALLDGVDPSRCFVPHHAPTWGLWPATLVAMALDAGSATVGLLGVDLGSADRANAAHEPLARLLGLIARWSRGRVLDCGPGGARKPGWPVGTLEQMADNQECPPFDACVRPGPTEADRCRAARHTLTVVGPVLARGRALAELAARVSTSARPSGALVDAVDELLSWGRTEEMREACQDGLGLSFLPRLWRTGVAPTLGARAWRPVTLALHELSAQADALRERVAA